MAKPFNQRLFSVLLAISSGLIIFWVLIIVWTFTIATRIAIRNEDWIVFTAFLLALGVCLGNLLYNYRLLRAYRSPVEAPTSYSRTASILLLCFYAICTALSIALFVVLFTELVEPRPYKIRFNIIPWLLMGGMLVLIVTSTWIIVLQIKLLRQLRRRVQAQEASLLEGLGQDVTT
jgi:hypothetical protein